MLTGVYHNSRRSFYRSPFGAVKTGEPVTIRISVPDTRVTALLRLWIDGTERIVSGERKEDVFEFKIVTPFTPGIVWYFFLLDTEHGRTYYSNPSGSGEGSIFGFPPPSYQLTVYSPIFQTPEWFREGIVYQVFPDRFARGGKRGGLGRIEYHKKLGRYVIVHEDWGDPVLYKPVGGQRHYDPCDFYGGDLAGIREKLPYIKSLGVNCLYLNPIFESASSHRYNTADYMKIDPVLGRDEDLKALVEDAKALGMKIMLDGVFSHTGDDSVYFNKRGTYGNDTGAYRSKASPYYEWYDFIEYPDKYRSWWEFSTLPEVNECTPSYMAFIKSVLERYAKLGITSWRLDVADELPDEFIAFLRAELKKLDEDGVLLGEVWDDASNKEGFGVRRKYVDGDALDSVTGYPLRNALFDFLLLRSNAGALAGRLTALRENYPKPFYDAHLNIMSTHDTVRALTALGGAPGRNALSREEQSRYELSPEQLTKGRARLILSIMTVMSIPGVPCIYYGDEIGMTGMADPFNRKPYPWKDGGDAGLLEIFRRLAAVRQESLVLKRGAAAFGALANDVFAVLRTHDDACALTLINRSEDSAGAIVTADRFAEGPDCDKLFLTQTLYDALTGEEFLCEGGTLRLTLPPLTGRMLMGKR